MSSLNKVMLIGNVGKNPDVKQTSSGSRYATFSLATTEKWKGKDGMKQEKTEWHNIFIGSDGLVKIVESYVSKGTKLYIEGKLKTIEFEKNGEKRYSTSITVDGFAGKLILLGGDKSSNNSEMGKPAINLGADIELNDEIPF